MAGFVGGLSLAAVAALQPGAVLSCDLRVFVSTRH